MSQEPFLERIGTSTFGLAGSAKEMLAFLGDMTVTFLAFFRLKAHYRTSDLFLLIQQCGAQALPIVTLISFLVGVILAFVGAVQLKQFGAQIFVAEKTITRPRSAAACRRAGLARAMALDPEVLFFDEPSAGLDRISFRLLDDLILELPGQFGATVVVVTHELASIFTIGNNSVLLDPRRQDYDCQR